MYQKTIVLSVLLFILSGCDNSSDSTDTLNQSTLEYLNTNGLRDSEFINCLLTNYPEFNKDNFGGVAALGCNSAINDLNGIQLFPALNLLKLYNANIENKVS